MKSKVKFMLSFGMLVLACVMAILNDWTVDRRLILLAVMFSFFGDMFLMNFARPQSLKNFPNFGLGMLAFAMAHICYAQAFSARLNILEMRTVYLGYLYGFFVFCMIAFVTLYKIATAGKKLDKGLLIACLAYCTVIGYNMIRIFGYSIATNRPLFVLPALGISLFFISDCLIALKKLLKTKSDMMEVGIWILYVVGQTMMIIG